MTDNNTILNRTASDIVTSALRKARIIPVRQPVSSIDMQIGLDALNNLIATLRADGWHMWKSEEYVLFLEKGKSDYFIGKSGDNSTELDQLLQTKISVNTTVSTNVIDVVSTSGFTGADNILTFDPSSSISGWTTSNSAVSSSGGVLNIANSAVNGYAQYTIETKLATEYFVDVDITQNTGVVTIEIYSGLSSTLITSFALTADGNQTVSFTSTESSTNVRIVNDNIAGDTDVVNLQLRETATGEKIGFRVSQSLREWNVVEKVINSTQLQVQNAIQNVGNVLQSVVAYKELPARPMKIRNYRSKNINFNDEIPMETWSRQEYMKQTNKVSEGLPTQAYYVPELNNGRLYVWQTASDVDQIVLFTADKPLNVIQSNIDKPDFPAEWFNMLTWGVAADIGPEYGINEKRQIILEGKAAKYKEMASDWDEEQGSLMMVPDLL